MAALEAAAASLSFKRLIVEVIIEVGRLSKHWNLPVLVTTSIQEKSFGSITTLAPLPTKGTFELPPQPLHLPNLASICMDLHLHHPNFGKLSKMNFPSLTETTHGSGVPVLPPIL